MKYLLILFVAIKSFAFGTEMPTPKLELFWNSAQDTLIVQLNVAKPWHITANSTPDEFASPAKILGLGPKDVFETPIWPIAEQREIKELQTVSWEFSGIVEVKIPLKSETPTPALEDITLEFEFQACSETMCLAPNSIFWNPKPSESQTKIQIQPTSKAEPQKKKWSWLLILGAFFGGLLLNLMPCVLPVLGIKVVQIVESNKGKSPWIASLLFSLGILTSLWAMAFGVIALRNAGEKVGWGFQLQDPLFVIILAAVFLVFSLNLLGLFEWTLPSKAAMNATRWSNLKGPFGSFLSGVFLTFLATPCSAPFMGSAVGVSFAMEPIYTFIIFTFLGLGLASPYLILAIVPSLQKWIPKPGAWMETFKSLSGFLLLGTLIYLFWVLNGIAPLWLIYVLIWFWILSISIWALGKYGSIYSPLWKRLLLRVLAVFILVFGAYSINQLPQGVLKMEVDDSWTPLTLENLEEARQKSTPTFINFTARWCWSCQINKKTVLASDDVNELFKSKNVSLMEADWTKRDPIISQVLQSYGRASVPTYILIDGKGQEHILSEVLTYSELESLLN